MESQLAALVKGWALHRSFLPESPGHLSPPELSVLCHRQPSQFGLPGLEHTGSQAALILCLAQEDVTHREPMKTLNGT